MSVKIRLMRIGAKKRPFYRVVAVDERSKRTGAYIELLGTYNPLIHPHEVILKQDRIDDWMKKGAVPSEGFLRIIGKAPQRPARSPKKQKPEEAPKLEVPIDVEASVKVPESDEANESNVSNSETEIPAEQTPVEEVPAPSEAPIEEIKS